MNNNKNNQSINQSVSQSVTSLFQERTYKIPMAQTEINNNQISVSYHKG